MYSLRLHELVRQTLSSNFILKKSQLALKRETELFQVREYGLQEISRVDRMLRGPCECSKFLA